MRKIKSVRVMGDKTYHIGSVVNGFVINGFIREENRVLAYCKNGEICLAVLNIGAVIEYMDDGICSRCKGKGCGNVSGGGALVGWKCEHCKGTGKNGFAPAEEQPEADAEQANYALLGKLAIKAITDEGNSFCAYFTKFKPSKDGSCTYCDGTCKWEEFCKLRQKVGV